MTEIAQRSGASIGCVYQYFPDKESVARALHSWYGDQMEEQLAPIIEKAGDLSAEETGAPSRRDDGGLRRRTPSISASARIAYPLCSQPGSAASPAQPDCRSVPRQK